MTRSEEIRVFAEVTEETGSHQLVLKFVDVTEPQDEDKTRKWNFHSLVWRQKLETTWSDRKIISCADFQAGAKLRRWSPSGSRNAGSSTKMTAYSAAESLLTVRD